MDDEWDDTWMTLDVIEELVTSPGQTSYPGPHPGCDTPHPHTHAQSQLGPTPDDIASPGETRGD